MSNTGFAEQRTVARNAAQVEFLAEHLEKRIFLSSFLFQLQQTFSVGSTPKALAVQNLGNGQPDLVVVNSADNTVGVLLGNGNGTFQPQQIYSTGALPYAVAIADLGNGHQDLIVANYNDATVSVLLGNGDGTFRPQMTFATGQGPIAVAVADLGNGHPDIIAANYAANTVTVLSGNGDGTFDLSGTYETGAGPDSVAAADLGNGKVDLVVSNYDDNNVSVLMGNGDGTFSPQVLLDAGTGPFSVAVANLANGDPDIVVANNRSSTVSVLFGDGTGNFSSQVNYPTGLYPSSVAVSDLGNGDPDLIVAANDSVTVLRGNADGTFVQYLDLTAGTRPYSVVAADLGNGQPDIAVTNSGDNTISVLLNNTANSLVFTRQPANIAAGVTLPPVVLNVENSDGNLITSNSSDVTLSVDSGPDGATLIGTTTVTAVNGVASFDGLTIRLPGTYTLGALSDGTFVQSTSFTVNFAAGSIGQLNPGYGVNGLTTNNLGFTSTNAVLEDGSQSILIGTIGVEPLEAFGIARYNADGSLDTSFGVDGVVTTRFGFTNDVPAAVVISNGKIIVAGTAYLSGASTGESEFAIAEYNSNGSPYIAFGNAAGQALINLSTTGTFSNDVLNSMVADSNRIYVAGSSNLSGDSGNDFVLSAINFSGALDPTFGTGGVSLVDFDGGDDGINSIALQPNGDIVAAGSASIAGVERIALARFLPNGRLDKKLGVLGKTTANLAGSQDTASSVVIQPSGQIVIGGSIATESGNSISSNFLVERYSSAGKLDRSFGKIGTVVTSFNQPSAVTQVILQSNGDIIASGKTTASLTGFISGQLQVALVRYTSRGVLDTSFDGTGTTVINLSTGAAISGLATETLASQLGTESIAADNEFDTFSRAAQGVVASAPGGAILTAGSNGTNAVLGEVLTMGVDLIATLMSSLPASEPKGFKATLSIGIKESGNLLATGLVQIQLQLIDDTQGDGAVNLNGAFQRIDLRQGQSHSYKLPVQFPLQITTGNYYMQMTIVNTTVAQDLDPADNIATSPTAVFLSAPEIKLEANQVLVTSMFKSGRPAGASLSLLNAGNLWARGKMPIDLYLDAQNNPSQTIKIFAEQLVVSLQPGASHIYILKMLLPKLLAAGSYTLVASIDPFNSLGSDDESKSRLTDVIPVLISA